MAINYECQNDTRNNGGTKRVQLIRVAQRRHNVV